VTGIVMVRQAHHDNWDTMTTGNIMTDGGTMTLSFVTLINNFVILSLSKGDWHRHGSTSNVILSASKGAWFDKLTMTIGPP
jgi:hypothetical protein